MSSLLERMKSVGTIKSTTIAESSFFKPKDIATTAIPIINVAFTGELTGGLVSGLTTIAGPSRHFKSNLGLVMVHAYMKKHSDAICLFYDSEFGVTPEYLLAHGIDNERVLHLPMTDIEQLKFDITKRLEEITVKDKVIIFIDSIGNLASKKEAEDALEGKSASDMTRAKQLKSVFRIITPHLTIKDIPCIVINHVYSTQELYSKQIVSGGTGIMYSSNLVIIVGRSQDKEGTELTGYEFSLQIEKSRFVKEKSKLSFTVKFDGGISKFSGLLDLALESGHVQKPKVGWYAKVNTDTGEIEDKLYREKDTHTMTFWKDILANPSYADFVKNKYKLATMKIENFSEDEENE